MKKLFTFIAIVVIANVLNAQEKCTNCEKNLVDNKKIASAIGRFNASKGQTSFAGGENSNAMGDYSFAFGHKANAGGFSSFAFGPEAKANGQYAYALGLNTSAKGKYSMVIGRNSTALGMSSISIGKKNNAVTGSSYLFGQGLEAMASTSITIGIGPSGEGNYLQNNKSNSLMVGFQSIYPTLFVEGYGSNNNDKTGSVGIGNITDPIAKLHILGDDDPARLTDASLLIESAGDNYSYFWVSDQGHTIKAKPNSDMVFELNEINDFSFQKGDVKIGLDYYLKTEEVRAITAGGLSLGDQAGNGIYIKTGGDIGIGTSTPSAKLDVNGTMEVSGNTKLNSNLSIGCNPHAGYVLSVKGKILSEDVTVVEEVGADFVFADDYKLPALEEVENYIAKNQHLAEIPSAKEMMEEGVDIGKFQIKLLQKLEELTLYTIEQQKAIKRQAEMIEELRAKIAR